MATSTKTATAKAAVIATSKEDNVRQFQLSTPRKKREIGRAPTVELCDPVFKQPLYTVERTGDSEIAFVYKVKAEDASRGLLKDDFIHGEIAGGVRAVEALGGKSQFVLGNPERPDAEWLEVTKNSRFTRINDFVVSMPDPIGKVQKLHWKHTKDVGGIFQKMDTLNMKLVDEASGGIVARFVHKPSIWVMEGTFEMHEDLGEEWDLKVFLSCLSVLKYNGLFFNLNVI